MVTETNNPNDWIGGDGEFKADIPNGEFWPLPLSIVV